MSENVKISNNFQKPNMVGTHYRLLLLTGENKGTSYYLLEKRIVLGRGKNVDVPILDKKSSREHLELVKIDDAYVLTDLESQNGTLVNDFKITQKKLADNDRVVIGKTVIRYNIIQIKENTKTLEESENNEDEETEEEEEETTPEALSKKRKFIFIVVLVAIFLLIMLDTPKETSVKFKKQKQFSSLKDNLSTQLRKKKRVANKTKEKEIGIIIHKGLRELREKNYYRAINLFDYALKINSEHYQATYYYHLAKQTLKNEIEQLFLKAARDRDSLKPYEAVKTYCSIQRLIDKNPNDERYISAIKNIHIVEEELGLLKDELKCN